MNGHDTSLRKGPLFLCMMVKNFFCFFRLNKISVHICIKENNPCEDPESFVRGGSTLMFFFFIFLLVDEGK